MFSRPKAGLVRDSIVAALAACFVLASATDRATASGAAAPPASKPNTPPARVQASKTSAQPAPVRVLTSRDGLKAVFNRDKGKVRLLAFLSPTCAHCMANVQKLQEVVLDKIDSPDVIVYAVWIKATGNDSQERIKHSRLVLTDPRVQHFWDPEHRLNAMLLDAVAFDVNLRFYDVFLLYDRDTEWDKRLPRPGFWMHEVRGAPGPLFNPTAIAVEVDKALAGQPLDTPKP